MKMINAMLLLLMPLFIAAQDPWIELTFTGIDGTSHRQLDSINILNLDEGCDTTLFYPDTILVLPYPVGIDENAPSGPGLKLKAYPNPFSARCHLEALIPGDERVSIIVYDFLGRAASLFSGVLPAGLHRFEFIPGAGNIHIIRMVQGDQSASVKVISLNDGTGIPEIIHKGQVSLEIQTPNFKFLISNFTYSPGDELLYSGYSGGIESVLHDSPDNSKAYTFQFAAGIPCPGDSSVSYMGQNYPTVQVYSQCWLQKNLNAGVMIDGMANMSDDGIIEKYCMANDSSFCETYGALYQWDEMMQYTISAGVQGICPPGWHVPADLEWRILEGSVDSLFNARDDIWNTQGFRGFDAGHRLKSDSLWSQNMNGINTVGFNALPGGTRGNGGFFLLLNENAPFWSSSTSTGSYVWYRVLTYNSEQVYRYSFDRYSGFGVRCIRDESKK